MLSDFFTILQSGLGTTGVASNTTTVARRGDRDGGSVTADLETSCPSAWRSLSAYGQDRHARCHPVALQR